MAKAKDTGTAGAASSVAQGAMEDKAASGTTEDQTSEVRASESETTKAESAVMTIAERLALSGAAPNREDVDPENPDDAKPDDKPPENLDDKATDGEFKADEVDGVSAQAQAKINARIHGINVKRKNAEAKTERAEAQLKDLGKKIQDGNIQAVMKMGLDPEYITTEEAKTLARFKNLREWKKWLRTHRDGYEGSSTKEDPSMTVAQVAEQEGAVEDELLDIGTAAQTLWMERAKLQRGDTAWGRKIRLERANKPTGKPDPKPPQLPAATGASRRPPTSAGSKKGKATFDNKEFSEAGGDEAALEKQYDKVFGG